MVRLGMAVGEGEAAAAVVIGARGVVPFRDFHAEGKSRVIEVGHIFIYEHPQH